MFDNKSTGMWPWRLFMLRNTRIISSICSVKLETSGSVVQSVPYTALWNTIFLYEQLAIIIRLINP